MWRSRWALVCLLGAACSPIGRVAVHAGHDGNDNAVLDEAEFRCAREAMPADSPYRMPLAREEPDPALAARLSVLPPRSRRAVLAAGLEPLLARILEARAASNEPSLELLEREHELELRLNALSAQVSAVEFEARCTSDMIDKTALALGQREQVRQLTIAAASLVVGAAIGTAAGAWALVDDESHGPIVLGIAGGGAATGLGAMALTHEMHPIRFVHTPNRLEPLERGSDPDHLYPTFVFRMLTFPQPSAQPSPRDALLAVWQRELDETLPPNDAPAASALLQGSGGRYDETLLALRARRFQHLEFSVQGIARDLELLDRSLVRLFTMPGSAPDKPQP
ncbi:MAG: hypothetical protein ABUL62_01045 [Myxococcales bacterium]